MKLPRYQINRASPASITAVVLMSISAIIRIAYVLLRDQTVPLPIGGIPVHLLLPVFAAAWFVYAVLFYASRAEMTCPAVTIGVVFFAVKAFSFASLLHTVLCLILYTAVLVLYHLTLLGVIPTKILLYPLFGLPLLYHMFVEDMQIYILADPRPTFLEWLPELSVLCIMAALLSVSFALTKRTSPGTTHSS